MTTKITRGSVTGLVLELAMIVVGVFLGTRAEQWRSDRADREMARAALVNFRTEVAHNRASLLEKRAYHRQLADSAGAFLNAPGPKTLSGFLRRSHFRGTESVDFEHTAWDLALATQALAHVESPLAYAVSRVYTRQQAFEAMEHGFMQSAFTPATFADTANGFGLTIAMVTYLGDVNIQEPALIELYDHLLPQLDAAIGGPVVPADAARGAAAPPPARKG